jgi:hypothetical protein
MTVSFNPLKANGQVFTHLPELDDLELSLSNANAADLLDALGIEDAFAASPWRSRASIGFDPFLSRRSSNTLPSSIAPTSLATVPWPRQPKPSPSA